MSQRGWTVVLVDLDGTIMDSAGGIVTCLVEALEELGMPVPPPARLVEFVGPPILDGLRDVVGVVGDEALTVLAHYRERYRDHGAFDAEPFPGMPQALTDLAGALPLAVATSKPESAAMRILEHFGLADRFAVIAGAAEDESRSTKSEVVGHCLQLLIERGVDVTRPVMIGDRSHDVEGAAAHSIPTIVAGWGYGSTAEASGSIAVADGPADLPAMVAAGPPRP